MSSPRSVGTDAFVVLVPPGVTAVSEGDIEEDGSAIHPLNDGMLVTATSYESSYFVEGVVFRDGEQVFVAQSTPRSNHVSQAGAKPFGMFQLWESFDDSHRMWYDVPVLPPFRVASNLHMSVHDKYRHVGSWQDFNGIEDLLDEAGITQFSRFICGYHIHGDTAICFAPSWQYCALDWYSQTSTMYQREPSVWLHHTLLDQVSPIQFYQSEVYRKKGLFTGWEGHRIGGSCE